MAIRLTACSALCAVLVLVGSGSAQGQVLVTDPNSECLKLDADQLGETFAFLRPLTPWRIISKDNPSLSIAADGNGGAVLAKTDCTTESQVWFQHFPVQGDKEFALVNTATPGLPRAMRIPEDGTLEVKLEPYKPCLSVPKSMLWTKDDPGQGGFYQIRSFKQTDLVLDGLFGKVTEGTKVGAFSEKLSRGSDNVLWKIKDFTDTTST